MNTRRNFIKGLAAAIAGSAVALPNILVAEAKDRFQWKRSAEGVWVLNPAYDDAPWQIECFLMPGGSPSNFYGLLHKRSEPLIIPDHLKEATFLL